MKQVIIIRVKNLKSADKLADEIIHIADKLGVWSLEEVKTARYNLMKLPNSTKTFRKWLR